MKPLSFTIAAAFTVETLFPQLITDPFDAGLVVGFIGAVAFILVVGFTGAVAFIGAVGFTGAVALA